MTAVLLAVKKEGAASKERKRKASIGRFFARAFLSSMDWLWRLTMIFLDRPICLPGFFRRLWDFLSPAVPRSTMFTFCAGFHFLMKFLMSFFGKVFRSLLTVAIAVRRSLSTAVGIFLVGFIQGMFPWLGFLGHFICCLVLWRLLVDFFTGFLLPSLSTLSNLLMGFISGIFSGLSLSLFLGPVYNLRAAILSIGRQFGRRFNRRKVTYFPEHLLEEIFAHLPAKSLVRYASLSKSFRACFYDRHFLRLKLARCRKLKLIVTTGINMLSVELDGSHGTPPILLPNPLSLDLKDLDSKNIICDLYGSTDGLILLGVYLIILERERRQGFFYILKGLYNPSIRKFQIISIPPLKEQVGYIGTITSCFGYDSSSHDYKVVELLMFENLEIWVYSFKSETWKRVCNLQVNLFNGHLGSRLSAYLDGSVYIPVNNTIVQFRLCDEQVQIISLPDENVTSSLIVIDEALCTMKTNGSVQEFYKFINGNWVQFLVLKEENMLGWTLLGKSADNRYLFNAGEHFLLYSESDGATEIPGVRVIDGFDFYIPVLETTVWP
ncbi:hypothetical protein SLEP1_g1767 [Rubroshorea leprosula]|uniref:F-box domain-containing protein n=1 Tax=Rubroshorea leprosula TaxID=152421 RepID=A0AAV5HNZ9_9ROSI|nr:hypothetical protein SLEP1_g1767 [Rubroshorea leprosula]